MTRDDIMALANQTAGQHWMDEAHIQRFAHLVYESVFRDANIAASRTILDAAVLTEREACAKVCEQERRKGYDDDADGALGRIAAAIRARSNT